MERQQMLVDEIKAARQENAALQATIEQLRRELAQIRTDNEFLTVASVISPSRDQVELTRSTLAKLVRDIDRCIAELSAC